jgi:hypothetical protein
VHLGQTQIQNQQVELGVGHQRRIGLRATGHVVHSRPCAPQGPQQAVGQHLVVFGDQYSHVCSSL